MGEQLFALERGYALVHNVREQLLAARLPLRVVRMCDPSLLVLVQECTLLTVHAQRGDLGELDFGPWEQIFYGEFDGLRRKRVLVKIIGQ